METINKEMNWADEQKNYLNQKRAKIDDLEVLISKINKPSKDKYEAIKRLKLLYEWYSITKHQGTFPTESIMEELLMDQSYQVVRYLNQEPVYEVGMFALSLKPSQRALEVKYLDRVQPIDGGRSVKAVDEYSVIKKRSRGECSLYDTAHMLAEIHFQYQAKYPSKRELSRRAWVEYSSLIFTKRTEKIISCYRDYMSSKVRAEIERDNEYNERLTADLLEMKETGLFETLELIENDIFSHVHFDIFTTGYDSWDTTWTVDEFINHQLNRKDAE